MKIIEFYGEGCPYCEAIKPEVEKLEKDGIEVEKLEVWNNTENKKKMEDLKALYDENCQGNFVVPSFFNPEKNSLICNPGSYEKLKEWLE